MAGKAHIRVVGNVGADAELKVTPNGKIVTSFSIASTPSIQKNGEWIDGETTWYRCAVWEDFGEIAAEIVKKGMTLTVTGKLSNRAFVDKEGNNRTSLEINVETLGVITKQGRNDRGKSRDDDSDWWTD